MADKTGGGAVDVSIRPRARPEAVDLTPNYVDLAREAASLHGIPEEIFLSLITQESNWDPTAGSSKGARGLTQIMPGTAATLSRDPEAALADPVMQIDMGARHLSDLYEKYGSWPLALSVYNAGAGDSDKPRVGYFDKSGQRHHVYDTKETQDYVLDILGRAGNADALLQRDASPERSREERMDLIERLYFAQPGARYDYETDSYIPIRPQARPFGYTE